ncbi:MAG TPA: orotidine-5'-phosphate decarboxylase, partial [Chthoniobacteraceae bacterium]|nr:orotidine-5'-phosphate decarboxylase [Chthoniobacteraceae bacterium]
ACSFWSVTQPATPAQKIIVALDVPTEADALKLIDTLGDTVRFYKIGLQLFTKCGPAFVQRVKATGARVFLDLKFLDIPNTVQHAVRSACEIGVDMMTIHLCGGGKMIAAAVAGAGDDPALILGVTVLTSSSRETLQETGVHGAVEDQVLRLAKLGVENGIRGVVASPQEISLLRQVFGKGLAIVTPGVRPEWAAANDQQRTLTPQAAVGAGADYLVIGRPITAHANPAEAARMIADEIG